MCCFPSQLMGKNRGRKHNVVDDGVESNFTAQWNIGYQNARQNFFSCFRINSKFEGQEPHLEKTEKMGFVLGYLMEKGHNVKLEFCALETEQKIPLLRQS